MSDNTISFPPAQTPAPNRVGQRRLFATPRSVLALMLREMYTTYGRSPGGYLWAVLEPIGGIALLSFAFSAIFAQPALGISFPIFYATGMLPFLFYSELAGKIATSLLFSKPLLTYPSVTYLDAILARFFLNALTQLMVFYIVFTGMLVIFENHTVLDIPIIVLGLTMAASLGLGIGTLNAFLFTRLPVWQRAWGIMMRPIFIISGIFFLFETIPEPFRSVLWYNPLVHVIGMVRKGVYPVYDAPYLSPLYVFVISGVCFTFGLLFLRRYYRDLLNDF